jgi:DNA-directed RNA polymerase subunit RPC12/RpoP
LGEIQLREAAEMPANLSIRAFKCPSCGAPQEPEAGTLTMKCSYCGGTIIIPESLRTPAPGSSGPSMGDVFNFGLKGVDLNKIVGNAMQLPEAISLAQRGQIDEAARIYSQITGMEHADAVQAVKAMSAGHAVSLTPGKEGVTWGQFETSYNSPNVSASGPTVDVSSSKRGCGAILGITALIGIIVAGLIAGAIYLFINNGGSLDAVLPAAFARKSLVFGSEGIGQGTFKDPRAVGVDGQGNITVADYDDGRVQTFDGEGNFLSGFSVKPDVGKVYVTGLAVDRDGTVYVAHSGMIQVFDPKGNPLSEIGDGEHRYESVVVGGDGKLYATSDNETIVRFKPDHSMDLEIPDTFTTVTGDIDIGTNLAADGLGNMYIVGSFHYLVLKYSPQGTYVDQFGGQAEGAGNQPGKFTSPRALAVDAHGRIFVADFFDIKVFEEGGNYITTIGLNDGVPFGIVADSKDHVYVVTSQNHVIRFDVKPPAEN